MKNARAPEQLPKAARRTISTRSNKFKENHHVLRAMRFSGHETFACRFAWLPKAYRLLSADPTALVDEDHSMVELGLGKNMVRSLRFWVDAMGVAIPRGMQGFELTSFGRAVFGTGGFDPYLEDTRTLWLLHWNLAARLDGQLFAWNFLLNHWPYPELTRSEGLSALTQESARLGYSHSAVTLAQHLDVFLHTYLRSRSAAGVEDSLDGPLVDLALLQVVGERHVDGARRESVFAFRRDAKPEITPELFAYCVNDYWCQRRVHEATLTLRELSTGEGSPGRIFKLTEDDVRARLEAYAQTPDAPFDYRASAVQGMLVRRSTAAWSFLAAVYARSRRHG